MTVGRSTPGPFRIVPFGLFRMARQVTAYHPKAPPHARRAPPNG